MHSSVEKLKKNKQETYKLFNEVAKTYDFLNHFLSFGIDIYWRKNLIRFIKKLFPKKNTLKALDLATGTGDLAIALNKTQIFQKVTAADPSVNMLEVAKIKNTQNFSEKNLIEFINAGAPNLPFKDNSFELVTISFGIRNFPTLDQSIKELSRILSDNGSLIILEFSLPKNKIIKFLYLFYFRKILPLLGKIISGHPYAYKYLNESVEDFPYGNDFCQLLNENGFKDSKAYPMSFGLVTLYHGRKE